MVAFAPVPSRLYNGRCARPTMLSVLVALNWLVAEVRLEERITRRQADELRDDLTECEEPTRSGLLQ